MASEGSNPEVRLCDDVHVTNPVNPLTFPNAWQLECSKKRMASMMVDSTAEFLNRLRNTVIVVGKGVGLRKPWTYLVEHGVIDLLVSIEGDALPHSSLIMRSDADLSRWSTAVLSELDKRWAMGCAGVSTVSLTANAMHKCDLSCKVFFLPGPNYAEVKREGGDGEVAWAFTINLIVKADALRKMRSLVVNTLACFSSLPMPVDPDQPIPWISVEDATDPKLPASSLDDHGLAQLSCYSIDIIAKHASGSVPAKICYEHVMRLDDSESGVVVTLQAKRNASVPPRDEWKDTCAINSSLFNVQDLPGLDKVESREIKSDQRGEYVSYNNAVRGTPATIEYRCMMQDKTDPEEEFFQHIVLPESLMADIRAELGAEHVAAESSATPVECKRVVESYNVDDEVGDLAAHLSLSNLLGSSQLENDCVQKLTFTDPSMAAALTKIKRWCNAAPDLAKSLLEKGTAVSFKKVSKYCNVEPEQVRLFVEAIQTALSTDSIQVALQQKRYSADFRTNPVKWPTASIRNMSLMKLRKCFDLSSMNVEAVNNRLKTVAGGDGMAIADTLFNATMIYRLFDCSYAMATGPETPYVIPVRIAQRTCNTVPIDAEESIRDGMNIMSNLMGTDVDLFQNKCFIDERAVSTCCEGIDQVVIRACIKQVCLSLPGKYDDAFSLLNSMTGTCNDIWLRLHRMVGLAKWYLPGNASPRCAPVHILRQITLSLMKAVCNPGWEGKQFVLRGMHTFRVDQHTGWMEHLDGFLKFNHDIHVPDEISNLADSEPLTMQPSVDAFEHFDVDEKFVLLFRFVKDEAVCRVQRLLEAFDDSLILLSAKQVVLNQSYQLPKTDSMTFCVQIPKVVDVLADILKHWKDQSFNDTMSAIACIGLIFNRVIQAFRRVSLAQREDAINLLFFSPFAATHMLAPSWIKTFSDFDMCVGEDGFPEYTYNLTLYTTHTLSWWMLLSAGAISDALGPWIPAKLFNRFGGAWYNHRVETSIAESNAGFGRMMVHFAHFNAHESFTWLMDNMGREQGDSFLFGAYEFSVGVPVSHSPLRALSRDHPVVLKMMKYLSDRTATMEYRPDTNADRQLEQQERSKPLNVPGTSTDGPLDRPDFDSETLKKGIYHAKKGIADAKRGQAIAVAATSASKQSWQADLRNSKMAVGGVIELADRVLDAYKTNTIRKPVLELEFMAIDVRTVAETRVGKEQLDQLDKRLNAIQKLKFAWRQQDKHADREDKARREKEAELAKKHAERDEAVKRLSDAIEYCPKQWEELVASGYDEELKKKLFDRLAKTLAACKADADPVEWVRLSDMRETWRGCLTASKRAVKQANPPPVVEAPRPTPPSPPVSPRTKAQRKQRKKQRDALATEQTAVGSNSAQETVAEPEASAIEQEEVAMAAALAASLETAEKERQRREMPAPEPMVIPLSAITAPAPRPADVESTVATALQCVVCMTNERSHVAVPCGHRCLCETCASKMIDACPMCRKPVQMWMHVFE